MQASPRSVAEETIRQDQAGMGRAQDKYQDPLAGESPELGLVSLLRQTVATLSPPAATTILEHPEALRSALAAAAQTLLNEPLPEELTVIKGQPARLLGHAEAAKKLAERTHLAGYQGDELLTSDEFAKRVGARSRQSVHNWLKKGRIVGWQSTKRGFVFPAEQLDERGRPLAGLEVVLSHFDGHYSAWNWLTDRHDALDGARPIDLLRQSEDARVEAAARGYAQGDFG